MHKYDLLIRAFQIYYCGKITFQFIFRILMNLAGTNISEGCLLELYLNNKCDSRQPVVQVIDFQQSQANEKEITIRVSDRLYFIDCTLSGNYLIQNDCIIETKNLTILTTIKRLQFVKLIDYFNKIEQGKICKLQIIIRKMQQICSCNEVMGSPQQIQQYIINNKKTAILSNHKELYHEAYSSIKKMHVKQSKDQDYHNNHKSEHTIIKIEPDVQYQQPIYYSNQSNNHSYHSQTNGTKTQKKQYITNTNDHPGFNESLTLQDIMHGKEGYLIGRLVRFKSTRKQTKDGPMTVCYLGLVDKYNELIRIHLAGRLAMSNQKILKKKKCYYIKGFDLVNVKNTGTQIRLKDKQYKIVQVYNDQLTRYLCNDYYHWDHVSDCQNEYVDVIGVVDDIQKKATYSPNNQLDPKSVIRVVIKNKFKSIRISFWTDQIKVLESFNLKKKEVIIIEDIKKKQSKYYDFGFESNLIQLNQGDNQLLLERFKDILPENIQQREPQNIRQLNELFEDDPNDSKLRTIVAYLTHCQENKIIYRLCDQCKKKVQKMATQCHQCGSEVLIFKYNCPLEFSDATGSMIVILFDVVANKLIGRTAMEISQMSEQQIEKTFENLFYKPYILSIQNRNKRIILRSIDEMNQVQQIATLRDNITKINNMITKQIW